MTTTNYFSNCKTIDEAKKKYYELAKVHHPDRGGNVETMQQINAQFEAFKPSSEKFTGESESFDGKEYANIINQLVNIPEIVIEIIGSFIWLSNTSKEIKDQIKGVNVGESYNRPMWHSKKVCWYFSPKNYRRFNNREFSMDEIRNIYGSTTVNKNEKQSLPA